MELAYKRFGSGPPIIILHGLYGSSDNWVSIAKELAENFEVFIPDQRNHGNSPASNSHSYDDLVRDVFVFVTHHDIRNPIIIGHSMGGKAAMAFTFRYPEMVKKLIVVDISPRSYKSLTDYSPQMLDHMNLINAMLGVNMDKMISRREVDLQLAETIKSLRLKSFLLKNVERTKDGKLKWRLNLDAIYKNLPNIAEGVIPEAGEYNKEAISDLPVLFIKGEKSDYIGEDDKVLIKSIFPVATLSTIPAAGHWLHYEQPGVFINTVRKFILD